ncbi:putative transcriptional regulator [Leptolyngbya sp. PCC 7375]|nr:putative transcriptional regulator [Leptolyngbya sp. PCC 7375]
MNMRETRRIIGNNLKARRKDLGVTMRQVAQAGGIGRTTLWKIECGRSSLPLESTPAVLKFLDLGEDPLVLLTPSRRKWGKGMIDQD